ncbi:MAG TPA: ABC transporter permease [Actinomycetota bacterium]|nr:ABC transporter permease [Actinomycetota bacterium]
MKAAAKTLLVPVLALIAALLVGAIVIVFTDPETLRAWASFGRNPGRALSLSWGLVSGAYGALFVGSLGSTRAVSETIVTATPLIFAGLSVALAFRAGLFNIGGEGQILAGAVGAAYIGFAFRELPMIVHLPFALIGGFTLGAAWGFIPGFLKARTGAHEVITTIMLNFIALSIVNFLLKTQTFLRPNRSDPISKIVSESAELPQLLGNQYRVHAGIILALLAAWGLWWLLFRSTLGFEFRSVGTNPNAAKYAGMSVGATYVIVMMMAGGLAGLAGATQILGIRKYMTPGFFGFGFDAIALALLGRSHPAGVVGAAFLFGALRAGALRMQADTSIPIDIIVVIQALVIVFIAAPTLVRALFRIKAERVAEPETFTKSWAS